MSSTTLVESPKLSKVFLLAEASPTSESLLLVSPIATLRSKFAAPLAQRANLLLPIHNPSFLATQEQHAEVATEASKWNTFLTDFQKSPKSFYFISNESDSRSPEIKSLTIMRANPFEHPQEEVEAYHIRFPIKPNILGQFIMLTPRILKYDAESGLLKSLGEVKGFRYMRQETRRERRKVVGTYRLRKGKDSQDFPHPNLTFTFPTDEDFRQLARELVGIHERIWYLNGESEQLPTRRYKPAT